jgi:hypothetical protein
VTTIDAGPRSWWEDEPHRLEFEIAEMAEVAEDLRWLDPKEEPSGGWEGTIPLWPFDRPPPPDLMRLVSDQPLVARIVCGHSFPMVEPSVYPLNADLPNIAFGWTTWHVAPDGALCMLQESAAWDPRCAVAELIPKVSGWYLEYQLLRRGLIEAMTESGIVSDSSLDKLLAEAAKNADD